MSGINGDKSRFHRQRKQKIARRQRNRGLLKGLAGQHKDYLVAVLKDYKTGTRKNELMTGVAKGLSDADIETLATYFSSSGPQ